MAGLSVVIPMTANTTGERGDDLCPHLAAHMPVAQFFGDMLLFTDLEALHGSLRDASGPHRSALFGPRLPSSMLRPKRARLCAVSSLTANSFGTSFAGSCCKSPKDLPLRFPDCCSYLFGTAFTP
jgi:hypothetical protein